MQGPYLSLINPFNHPFIQIPPSCNFPPEFAVDLKLDPLDLRLQHNHQRLRQRWALADCTAAALRDDRSHGSSEYDAGQEFRIAKP